MLSIFKKRCPRCGGNKINTVSRSLLARVRRFTVVMFLPLALFIRPKSDLLVCTSCGFSWEKR